VKAVLYGTRGCSGTVVETVVPGLRAGHPENEVWFPTEVIIQLWFVPGHYKKKIK
jgi:hypothetical protein